MKLTRIARASASDEVYDQLAASIVGGDVAPGDALPSERSLADGLGVSRPVVREALKRLAHAGLVEIRHGGSTTVTDYRRIAGPDLLPAMLLDQRGELDLEVARGIVEARSELGPPVAAAAARTASVSDHAGLAAIVDQMREEADLAHLQRLALDFWDEVVDLSGNLVYRLLFNALRRAYEPVMDALAIVMRDEVSDVDGYAAVADAIRRGDAEDAADAVHAVVDRGARAAVEVIDALLTDPTDAPTDARGPV